MKRNEQANIHWIFGLLSFALLEELVTVPVVLGELWALHKHWGMKWMRSTQIKYKSANKTKASE